MKYYNFKARQAGMTLIELTVVLLVLIGLAGLMIPYVSGFISTTHDSTGTNNLARLNSNVQRFQGQFMSLPDDMHSLAETSTGAVYGDMMNGSMFTAVTFSSDGTMTVQPASEIQLESLARVGLSSIFDMKDNASNGSKTFDAGNTSVAVPSPMMGPAASVDLVKLNKGDATSIEDHLADAFGMQASEFNAICNDYIVMGIGQESQLIGRTMSDAPIHFAQNGDMGPENKYNRFVAVLEVDKINGDTVTVVDAESELSNIAQDCGETTSQAKFLGTAMVMMDNHLRGLAHEMNHTYSNISAQ